MTNTAHFNLPIAQSTDLYNHLTIDNAAFNLIDMQMYDNQNAAFSTATYSKTGNVHVIAEAIDTCPIMYFQATADFRSGDTFTVNGNTVTARLPNGSGLGDYAFRVNSNVVGILNGGIFTVLTNVSQTDIAAMLGVTEQTATATYQHSVGTYFIYNNNFYITTVNIPIGGTINPGTNCTATTVGAEITALNQPLIAPNAGAHNCIYRGKNLGTSVTTAQYAAISAGTFEDLCIGDYWTIGGVNYRIAAFDYYWNCGDTPLNTHHAVIVPEKNLYSAVMNTDNTTAGGYVGSQMYTTNLAQAKTTIKAAFSGHVVNHRIYLTNAVSNGYASAGAWYDSEVDLMNEQMAYGSGIYSPVSTGSVVPANYRVEKNQLPLFAMDSAMLNTRENYWLRDVISTTVFAHVYDSGNAGANGASISFGVRPAFCIS